MRNIRWFLVLSLLLVALATQAQESTSEPEATPSVESSPEATESSEPTAEATEEASPTATVQGGTYVVQRGDNLFRIALRNGLTTRALAEANGITNPALIFVGQTLIIPGSSEPVGTPTPEATQAPTEAPTEVASTETPEPETDSATTTYVVQPGDTLFRIALRNSTTVQQLVSLNNISNPNLIFVGQRLVLPQAAEEDESATEAPSEAEVTETPVAMEEASLQVTFSGGIEVYLGQDVNALTSQVSQIQAEWVKIVVDWGEIEANQGEADFAAIDEAVQAFDAAGLNIMLTLIGSPDWARPSATEYALSLSVFHAPPDDLNAFGTFAGTVAARYAGQVDAYEIWSEPNIRRNWLNPAARLVDVTRNGETVQEPTDAGLAPVRYIDLLEAAYRGIKDADSDAIVLTAGLAPTGFNDFYNAIDSFVFFEELLKQGALNFSDGVGVHLDGFSNAPDAECCGTADTEPAFDESYHFFFGISLSNYREILDRNGGSEEAIWITRFGWGTGENALAAPEPIAQDYLANNSADEQAQYTADGLAFARETGYVAAAIVYNLNGCAVGGTEACFYSLIDVTGAARPAFSSVQSALQGE